MTERDGALDGLRGLAILLVLLVHSVAVLAPAGLFRSIGGWMGTMGVDLFFVLSGYLITGILLRTRGQADYFRHFYIRRAQRILPLYLLFVACYITLALRGVFPADKFFLYPFLLQNLLPFLGQPFQWPGNITWSLCVEEHFYLLWPLLVALLPRRALVHACLAALALSFVTRLAFSASDTIPYLTTPARLDGLALGAIAALGWNRKFTNLAWLAAAVAGACVLKAMGTPLAMALDKTFVSLAFALVLLNRARWATALAWKPLQYFGRRSYGLYLIHAMVFFLAERALGSPHWWNFVPLTLGTTLLLAELSWRWIESPILQLDLRRWNGSQPVAGR